MKKSAFIIFVSFLFSAALSAADMLVNVSEEPAGGNCANGGVKIEIGEDTSEDGILDQGEIDHAKTQYVCNGAAGSNGLQQLVSVTDEPAGSNCETGGIKIEVGNDENGSGELDEEEVVPAKTRYVCNGDNGKNALSKTSEEPAGDNCANGGIRVEVGIDNNGNGDLDANEVINSQTKYVCKGSDGDNGKNALAKVSDEPKGENCTNNDGIKIEIGIDTDGNGVLDANEVTDTEYVCGGKNGHTGEPGEKGDQGAPGVDGKDGTDGTPGEKGDQGPKGDQGEQGDQGATGEAGRNGSASLVSVVDEPKGGNCAAGGKKIAVGLDANGNGALDEDEIDPESVYYVCNGRDAEEAGLSSSSTGCAMTKVDGDFDWIYAVFAVISAFCAFFATKFVRR